MTYRTTRRRRNVVFVALLGLVVLVIALAVRYRTEERETADYLALAREIADSELAISTGLADLIASIGDLERQDILLRLETLAVDSDVLRERVDAAGVPSRAAESGGLFGVAVESWSTAVAELDDAFLTILDLPDDDPTGDAMLIAAFDGLRVGDAAYRRFLATVDGLDTDIGVDEFADVSFTGGINEPLFDSATIAQRLRLIRRLAETHDVAVTAKLEPEPVTDPNGIPVVPLAATYSVLAVVTNGGNVGEESITVSLRIAPSGGETESIELTQLVPFLDPGSATTVEFVALDLAPGTFFDLRLVASIAEDSDITNNTFELSFFTNEAA